MLRRIFYVSEMAPSLSKVEIQAIVSPSTVWNRRKDATGVLVASATHFAQGIEARPDVIDAVMRRIRADGHHFDIRVQLDEAIQSRLFAQWRMAYAARLDLSDRLAALHSRIESQEELESALRVLAEACSGVTADL